MKKSFMKVLALAVATSVFLTACTKPADPVVPSTEGDTPTVEASETVEPTEEAEVEVDNPANARQNASDTLVIGIPSPPQGRFLPQYYTSSYDSMVATLVFDNLVNVNIDGAPEVNAHIVESYDFSADYKEMKFVLKDGLNFSDGTPLTADDVKFTYEIYADPTYDGRSDVAKYFVGYEEYTNGDAEDFTGVEVVDDKTVIFHFTESQRPNLGYCSTGIMPRAAYPEFAKGTAKETFASRESEPIGSGPYVVKEFADGQYAHLEVNENYWDKANFKSNVKNVIYREAEQSTELDMLLTGEVDILSGQIDLDNVERVTEEGAEFINFVQYPRAGYGFVHFNCESEITSDVAVRKALAYAYNGDGFVEAQYGDLAFRLQTPLIKPTWVYSDEFNAELIDYSYNPEKAVEVLEAAGWVLNADGIREKDGKELKVRFLGMPEHSVTDNLIPIMIENYEAVGIKMEGSNVEFNSLMDKVRNDDTKGEWEMYFMATSWTSGDPHGSRLTYTTENIGTGKDNAPRYSNARVDELYTAGANEMEVANAIPIYQEIYTILNDELPTIQIYSNTYTDMVNSRIIGLEGIGSFFQIQHILAEGNVNIVE